MVEFVAWLLHLPVFDAVSRDSRARRFLRARRIATPGQKYGVCCAGWRTLRETRHRFLVRPAILSALPVALHPVPAQSKQTWFAYSHALLLLPLNIRPPHT